YILFQGTSVGQVSGFSSDFIGEHEEPIPEPSSTLSLLALGILGTSSTLKRKLKSSKFTEKETTKVS
ncbi:MAG: PEP-CTERM sorting domain-containing protein, partial [Snowella sp.]|nr:PEP-CTERM sorting domain-containing protein [Snowella sp.]